MKRMRRSPHGYTYIGLLFFVLLAGIGLSVTGHWWRMEIRRDREKELLFVGDQFRRAIASYHTSTAGKNQYPQSLEDLLEDRRHPNPVRHLRQIYRDPITGSADWTLIKEQERIIGVSSRSEDKPIKSAGFPERYQEFNNATSYAGWRFIYRQTPVKADPSTNPPLEGGGTPPVDQ